MVLVLVLGGKRGGREEGEVGLLPAALVVEAGAFASSSTLAGGGGVAVRVWYREDRMDLVSE